MTRKIVINTKSSGKFEKRTINGREHIVTSMVSIEGDSVMNRLFYPGHEVAASYQQLNDLPAPASHPEIDGRKVSASHPLAMNAHNIGAFVTSPRLDGKKVINELAIDVAVARKDERGVETLRRIQEGERIGVSTGLNATLVQMDGEHNGKPYQGIVSNIQYDHVAILLDEMPAGESTYTQNSEQVLICNMDADESVNELREALNLLARKRYATEQRPYGAWVVDILMDPARVVVEVDDEKMLSIPFGFDDNGDVMFTGDAVEVERKTSFEPVGNAADDVIPTEGTDVDMKRLLAFLVANSAFSLTSKDIKRLEGLDEAGLAEELANSVQPVITEEAARDALKEHGLTVNEKDFDADGYAEYLDNKDKFAEFKAAQEETRKRTIDEIVANSDMEADDLEGMDDARLNKLAKSLVPAQDFSGGAPAVAMSNRERGGATDEGVVY